jgi:hypothetical protein
MALVGNFHAEVIVSCLNRVIESLGGRERPIARVFRELFNLVRKAEDRTNKNRRVNGYKGSSSFGLFQCKLKDLVKTERAKLKAG